MANVIPDYLVDEPSVIGELCLPEKTHLPDGRELGEVLADLEERIARLESSLPGGELTANDTN